MLRSLRRGELQYVVGHCRHRNAKLLPSHLYVGDSGNPCPSELERWRTRPFHGCLGTQDTEARRLYSMNLFHLVLKFALDTHYSCVTKLESKVDNTEKMVRTVSNSGA